MEGARVWVARRGAGVGASRVASLGKWRGLEEEGSTRSAPGRVGSRFDFSRAQLVPMVTWAVAERKEKGCF